MAILVFQHSDLSTPGRLGLTLRDHGHKLRVVRPDRGEHVPPDLDGVTGVVSLGGPQNVDEHRAAPTRWPWLEQEMALLREAHRRQLPVIGLCLGSQMMAAALGGAVTPMPAGPEMGFCPLNVLPAGQTDTALAGIAWASRTFQVHGREVSTPPPGAVVLASSPVCKVQAWRAGLRTYGFQFHFECDRQAIDAFIRDDAADFRKAGLTPEQATRQADEHYASYARLADRLCLNLAQWVFATRLRGASGRDMSKGSAAVTLVG